MRTTEFNGLHYIASSETILGGTTVLTRVINKERHSYESINIDKDWFVLTQGIFHNNNITNNFFVVVREGIQIMSVRYE